MIGPGPESVVPFARTSHAPRQRKRPSENADEALGVAGEAAPELVFVVNSQGRIIGFTPGLGIVPFVPPEVFLGRHVPEVLPPSVAQKAMAAIEAAITTQELQTIEYELLEDGVSRRYECRIAATGPDEVLAFVRNCAGAKEGERQRHLIALSVCAKAAFAGENRYSLTLREFMVLGLLIEGLADKEISALLGCSTSTASKHVAKTMTKLDARSRTEAAVRALRQHVLPLAYDQHAGA